LARQGANAALIEDRQGRSRNSEAVSRYVARFGADDEATQYASLHGIEVKTSEPESLAPIDCPRCGHQTPHDEPMCVHCGRAVDAVAAEEADKVRSVLRERMATADDPEERLSILETLGTMEEPEAATDIVEAATQVAKAHDNSTSTSSS
jgi:hypothetical protein